MGGLAMARCWMPIFAQSYCPVNTRYIITHFALSYIYIAKLVILTSAIKSTLNSIRICTIIKSLLFLVPFCISVDSCINLNLENITVLYMCDIYHVILQYELICMYSSTYIAYLLPSYSGYLIIVHIIVNGRLHFACLSLVAVPYNIG